MSIAIDQILGAGLCIVFLGIILLIVRRSRLFRAFMAIRRHLIEQANAAGDLDRAARLSHELHVCEVRLSNYAIWLICAGSAIAVFAVVLLVHGTRTI